MSVNSSTAMKLCKRPHGRRAIRRLSPPPTTGTGSSFPAPALHLQMFPIPARARGLSCAVRPAASLPVSRPTRISDTGALNRRLSSDPWRGASSARWSGPAWRGSGRSATSSAMDMVGPVGAGKLRPVRLLAQPAHAVNQSTPKGIGHVLFSLCWLAQRTPVAQVPANLRLHRLRDRVVPRFPRASVGPAEAEIGA